MKFWGQKFRVTERKGFFQRFHTRVYPCDMNEIASGKSFSKNPWVIFYPYSSEKKSIIPNPVVLFEAIRSMKKTEHLEPIGVTAINSGMRNNEILKLKKGRVDFRDGYILIEDTKSGEVRKICTNRILTEMLRKAINSNNGSEYVFCRKAGLAGFLQCLCPRSSEG